MTVRRSSSPNARLARASLAAALLAASSPALAPGASAQSAERRTPDAPRLAADAAALRAAARRALPQLDGSLEEAGLDSAVEVRRDRWGVPHIYARTQRDLFFAQGYVAAQDRLWQMEMWRRQGEGRLAEVLGPAAAARDRHARLFRYRGDMQREWESYAPDTREIAAAFARGVNAWMARATREGRLPVEFALLDFTPEPWAPEVVLARTTPLSGVGNASSEVLRARLVALLGAERAAQVMPPDPVRVLDPVPGLDLSGIGPASLGGYGSAFSDVAYHRVDGSNNWVVSGKLTATGKPLLANDPHRAITNPAVRYLTHLVGPGWNVIGAGEPASPGVAIGHNDRIAFGLTVVGMDQADLYVEQLAPCADRGSPPGAAVGAAGVRCVMHDGAPTPVATIVDTIRVRGEAPRVVRLEFTHHGPVVAEDSARGRLFAVRSVHDQPGTASYLASLSMGRARDWKEFEASMARWLMPSENMIYADVDGNIGWIAAGIMPRRRWSGMLPVPGDGRFEWEGFVPGAELPRAFNPPEGFIATSNDNILPAGYAIPLSHEWATRYRIDRVRQMLRAGSRFTAEDFMRMQRDERSLLAESIVPVLVAAADRMGARDRPAVETLARWDFRLDRDRVAPTIFEAWAPALARRLLEARLPAGAAALVAARPDFEEAENAMVALDSSADMPTQRVRDSLALVALDEAVADLRKRFGADTAAWRWGRVHVATFWHPLARAFDLPPASRAGSGTTVNLTSGADFRQTHGASFREVIDLADWDNSWVTQVPGQSANPASPHYADLLPLWARDEFFPLVYSRERVERETAHVLRLVPAR